MNKFADELAKEFVQRAKQFIQNYKKSVTDKKSFTPPVDQPGIPSKPLYKDTRPEAVMFIDICDSTSTMGTYGIDHYLSMFSTLDLIFKSKSDKYASSYKKGLGDGFMGIFPDSDKAVTAALEILSDIDQYNKAASEEKKINLRIGIAYGEIKIGYDEDRYGIPVNEASRIEGFQIKNLPEEFYTLSIEPSEFPEKNRILVTHRVYVTLKGDINCEMIVKAPLKGLDGMDYYIYQIKPN